MLGKNITILLVEDDSRILRLEQRVMESEGYRVLAANSAEEALNLLAQETPDLVLLDVGLPGIDGFTACQRIREFSPIPVIMVTGLDDETKKVEGLDVGADDYITKPFMLKEMAARVRAALRRAAGNADVQAAPVFQLGELTIDFVSNRVTVAGAEVVLSDTEHRLLGYLARNAGRIVTPDQIMERVWGYDSWGDPHLLQVTIYRLRLKLEAAGSKTRYIQTRRGIGYSLALNEPNKKQG